MTLIQGTVAGLKSAYEIAKGIAELKNMTDVQGRVIELQNTILDAQSAAMAANAEQFAAIEELRKLKGELQEIRGWEAERQRYKLRKPTQQSTGVVYALKKEQNHKDEPPHYICTTCYEAGRKSMLSLTQLERGGYFCWVCPVCKTSVSSGTRGATEAEFDDS